MSINTHLLFQLLNSFLPLFFFKILCSRNNRNSNRFRLEEERSTSCAWESWDIVMQKSHKVLVRGSGRSMHRNLNYRHPMGRMSKSDGRSQTPNVKLKSFGVSSRFESEMASEDSSNNKRKSVNLSYTGNKTDSLGIPVHVFPISQMSRSQKRELRNQFELELDQARSYRKKIESKEIQGTSSGSVPTVIDSHSSRLEARCSESNPVKGGLGPCAVQASGSFQVANGLGRQGVVQSSAKENRHLINEHYLYCNSVSSKGNIASAEKPNSKGSIKRGLLEGFEMRNIKRQRVDSVQNKTYPEQMKQCADILKKLMSHRFGWVFNVRVDPVALKIPDYFKIIKKPMDLGTIKSRLEKRCYLSPNDCAADVRLTFANAMKFNPPANDVHRMAITLKKLFERKWSLVETRLAGEEVYRKITQSVQLIPTKKQLGKKKILEVEDNKSKVSSDVNCASASTVLFEQKSKDEICRPPMSFIEKAKLSKDLEELSDNIPEQVYTFLKKHTGFTQCEGEVEVDIESFNDVKLWELQILVSNYLRERERGAEFSQVSEPVKLHPNSRTVVEFGCMSPKIAQQDVSCGEHVHVGADNMQTINFPSGDSEEVTVASIKPSSSSSSSSSDSGSSSSDSDSESSPGSDMVTDEVHYTDEHPKGSVDSTSGNKHIAQSDPETTGVKSAVSVLDEDNVYPKAAVSITDAAHQEGESTPPGRQVSTQRLLRAAMLKSRFADTILKAQEKTLKQHNSRDPENLRHEKEELEKSQRKEKERIQAEAKAAEALRKRSEVEATVTAKQKREMEREAARLALQKIEKTVEIEENDQILKDLERLSCVPGDYIPSSGDEISTVSSVDGLVTFPLQGRNPLEQLGLFIKSDDEDEETIADFAAGNGLLEEGEID